LRANRSGENNQFTYKARILLGRDLVIGGQLDEGLRMLRSIPKKAGDYYVLAQIYVKDYEKRFLGKAGESH